MIPPQQGISKIFKGLSAKVRGKEGVVDGAVCKYDGIIHDGYIQVIASTFLHCFLQKSQQEIYDTGVEVVCLKTCTFHEMKRHIQCEVFRLSLERVNIVLQLERLA